MSSVNTFSDLFSDILKTEFEESDNAPYQLQETVKSISSNGLLQQFPEKNRLWLLKELSRWRKKLGNNSFKPTLQNLYIFCALTGTTPNDILLPNRFYKGPDRIEYLSYRALKSLLAYIKKKKHLSENQIVPVLYAPEKMTTAFLSIYKRRVNSKDDIYVQFLVSFVEQPGKEDSLGGINTISCGEYNVSVPEKNKYTFQAVYRQMKKTFKSATSDLQSIITDEFYGEFGDWASGLNTDDEPLCKYFPLPAIKTTGRKGRSLDELVGSHKRISSSVENKR